MKTENKIKLILIIFSTAIVIILVTSIYYFFNKYSYIDFYKRLETRTKIALEYNFSKDTLSAEHLMRLRTQYLDKLEQEQESIIELKPKYSPKTLSIQYGFTESFFQNLFTNGYAEGKDGNIFYTGKKHSDAGKDYLVIVSAENYYASHHLVFLRNLLLLSVVSVILISFVLTLYFSKYIFGPIKEITDNVKQISTENIHLRLENKSNSNEIKELIHTFNDLLNRIETSFETQKNFVSNASHEFITPLTSIIGEADVALSKPRSADEYIETIKIILDEAEKLDKKTKALLFLAQTGFNGKAQKFEKVRIDQLLWDVKETIEKINSKSNIHIDLSLLPENPLNLKVHGNEQLLHLAISNIISNACKYSDYQKVNVSIGATDTHVFIVIKDVGIGIPENEMRYIYDPFFRASNTKKYEGFGIGLPLTRNIIKMHEGEIIVSSKVNLGTTVQINLPIGKFNLL